MSLRNFPVTASVATISGLAFAGLLAMPLLGLQKTGTEKLLLDIAAFTVPLTPFIALALVGKEAVHAFNPERSALSRTFSKAVCAGGIVAAALLPLMQFMPYNNPWASVGFAYAVGLTAYLGGPLSIAAGLTRNTGLKSTPHTPSP